MWRAPLGGPWRTGPGRAQPGRRAKTRNFFWKTSWGIFSLCTGSLGAGMGGPGPGRARAARYEKATPFRPVLGHVASPNSSPEGENRLCPSGAPPWLRRSSLVGREALPVPLTSHNTSGTVVPARFLPRGRRWEGPGASWSPAAAATLGNLAYGPRGLLLGRGPGYVL